MTHAEHVARDERALADAALSFLAAECSHGPERKALELAGARVRAQRAETCTECSGTGWKASRLEEQISGRLVRVAEECSCDNGRKR